MTATSLLILSIVILSVFFVFETYLEVSNASRFSQKIPPILGDVYDEDEYKKSQSYKMAKFKLSRFQSILSFSSILVLLLVGGFGYLDGFLRYYITNETLVTLAFFGVLSVISSLSQMPFSYYNTFVIEEKFGFNKTTTTIFFLDVLKSTAMTFVLGGFVLWALVSFYAYFEEDFWLLAWLMLTVVMLLINMFYTKLIVPLFNKQYPLEEGSLRSKIEAYTLKVGFMLPIIKVIDGSKRSTKANAYFSGFGKQKQITLYDTLIDELEEDEIIAVLAHEVGHYKRKHIIYNLLLGVLTTGLLFWMLSICLKFSVFAEVLGSTQQSFHTSLLLFGILYSPIANVLGLLTNFLSRKFEYEADDYAKYTFKASSLISSLKKLSKKSLSNLTPHPLYEWYYYTHPSLIKRVQNLKK